MIGPFIAIATNSGLLKSNYWLNLFYTQLKFSSEQQFLILIGSIVIAAYYVKAFIGFNAQKAIFEFAYNLRADLSCKLMQAYLKAPYSFHLRVNSARLIQNVITSTDQFCLGLVMPGLTSISNAVIILALIILLIKTNATALIFIGMTFLVVLGLLHPLKGRLASWGRDGWKASGEMIRVVNHGLGGFKETRVLGCESYFESQMEEQAKQCARNLGLASSYGNFPRFVIEAFMISFLIVFTLLFIQFNPGNEQSLTVVLGIFALASMRLLPAIGNLVTGSNMARSNIHSLNQLHFDFKELEKEEILPELRSVSHFENVLPDQDRKVIIFNKEVCIDDLNFRYPGSKKNALNEISLTIHKGESIGLIGKSGSGKTTLVDVLLGLFIPQSGDIKVDGTSVYNNLRSWQDMLGYVPQSIFLIDDTLERNIAFGIPDHLVDQDKLRAAIEMAQLSEVVEQLPDGIKTVVGERGVLLSGGQRQRVGIARVLYHEREILVFDEATAALDEETEQLVTQATKALSGTKTIIIIAHRLKTIEHCDCIYQIGQGHILKSGSYREVVLGQQ
jgi:ABC-type multidrug transport system fused ATPase/permease subunit